MNEERRKESPMIEELSRRLGKAEGAIEEFAKEVREEFKKMAAQLAPLPKFMDKTDEFLTLLNNVNNHIKETHGEHEKRITALEKDKIARDAKSGVFKNGWVWFGVPLILLLILFIVGGWWASVQRPQMTINSSPIMNAEKK